MTSAVGSCQNLIFLWRDVIPSIVRRDSFANNTVTLSQSFVKLQREIDLSHNWLAVSWVQLSSGVLILFPYGGGEGAYYTRVHFDRHFETV